MRPRQLTSEERRALTGVLDRAENTLVLLHGGFLSFYAEGTRLEARLDLRDEEAPRPFGEERSPEEREPS